MLSGSPGGSQSSTLLVTISKRRLTSKKLRWRSHRRTISRSASSAILAPLSALEACVKRPAPQESRLCRERVAPAAREEDPYRQGSSALGCQRVDVPSDTVHQCLVAA